MKSEAPDATQITVAPNSGWWPTPQDTQPPGPDTMVRMGGSLGPDTPVPATQPDAPKAATPASVESPSQQPVAAPPQPAPAEKPVHIPSGPNTEPQYAAGLKQEKEAEAAKAGALSDLGNAQAKILTDSQASRDTATQAIDKDWKDNEAASKTLADNIASFRVDPNGYWSHQSTGSKIAKSIAMILGGIGAGMTGGQNPVLQIIQKHIEDDVDAQKTHLGAMKTQLEHYIQRGHSLQDARKLVVADSMDRVKGQIEAATAKFNSPIAIAAGQQAIGALDKKASMDRQSIYNSKLENQQKAIGIQAEIQNMTAQKQTLAMMNRLTSGEGFDQRVLELPAFKEYRERKVELPDGSIAFAKDSASATKAQEQHSSIDDLSKPLEEYNALFKNGHPTVSPSDKGAAESLRSRLVAALGNMRDAGSLKGAEYTERLAEVPDITDIFTMKGAAKLKELSRLVDDKRATVNGTLVTRKSQQPSAGVRF